MIAVPGHIYVQGAKFKIMSLGNKLACVDYSTEFKVTKN